MREVVDKCRGSKGEELRKNAEAVKVQLLGAWTDDGVAAKNLRAFLDKYSGHN